MTPQQRKNNQPTTPLKHKLQISPPRQHNTQPTKTNQITNQVTNATNQQNKPKQQNQTKPKQRNKSKQQQLAL